jgi:hypothetical protein
MTRDEFVQRQTADAEELRQKVLADRTASVALVGLASDAEGWVQSYMAALSPNYDFSKNVRYE